MLNSAGFLSFSPDLVRLMTLSSVLTSLKIVTADLDAQDDPLYTANPN
jgi:hypothetical protein